MSPLRFVAVWFAIVTVSWAQPQYCTMAQVRDSLGGIKNIWGNDPAFFGAGNVPAIYANWQQYLTSVSGTQPGTKGADWAWNSQSSIRQSRPGWLAE